MILYITHSPVLEQNVNKKKCKRITQIQQFFTEIKIMAL
jgi:hypothetical protein